MLHAHDRLPLTRPPGQRRQDGVATHADLAVPILIVDDDRRVGMALSFMLTARGFTEVRAVRSAARAIAVAQTFLPRMVFLDLELPGADSLAIAHQLRREARQRQLRLIALTSDAKHPRRDEARKAGFERFLTKPVTNEELDAILLKESDT